MHRSLALLAATLLLAGCLGDDTPDDATPTPEPTPEPEAAREPKLVTGSGTVTSAGTPGGSVGTGSGGASVTVDEGATLLYAEIFWGDPVTDLNLALASPEAGDIQGTPNYDYTAEGGAPGMPDSPHSLTITGAELLLGEWDATAFANGAAAQTEYDLALTVFYGETEVPEGYSGFTA